MKIKNILLISLVILAFVSCSKDEGSDGPKEPVDAVVSVMASSVVPSTKATGDNKGTLEEHISALSAYIFKQDGTLAGYKTVTSTNGKSVDSIDGILIKITPGNSDTSNEQFKMVLLANTQNLNITKLEDFENYPLGKDVETYIVGNSELPMSSEVFTITGIKKSEKDAGGNWITNNWATADGERVLEKKEDASEIVLTRMLARVEVNSVTVNLNAYEDATFNLKTIALMNVRTNADLSRKGIGDYVKGYQSGGYNYLPLDEAWWIPTIDNSEENHCTIVTGLKQAYDFGAFGMNKGEYTFADPINNTSVANPFFYRYIYPNSKKGIDGAKYETGIVVGGIFKFQGGKEVTKHFIVILRDPTGNNNFPQVLANTVYKVDIDIQGEGSEDENHPQKTALVTVDITVEKWKPIRQEEDLDDPITPME